MKLGFRGRSGVPTTPPPIKAAPSPRYNDLTRPRSLRWDAEEQKDVPAECGTSGRLWDSTKEGGRRFSDLHATAADPSLRQSTSTGSSEQLCDDGEFPPPWQGSVALPDNDEEIMTAAQSWVEQMLHNTGDDVQGVLGSARNMLADGRVLCRVANGIAPGSVEAVRKEDSTSSHASNMCSFLIACRKLGVPEGALFDVDDRDPKRIGLCLHVLSRVAQDNAPHFTGPFLATHSSHSSPRGASSNKSPVDETIIDGINDGQMDKQRGVPHSPGPAEASHSSSSSTSALEALDKEDIHNTGHADQPKQQQYFPATPDSRHGPPLMHRPHFPPPAHPAPSHPPAAALPWPLDPSTAATPGDTVADLSKDCPPPSPPRQRPLSLPSRLCPTDSGDPIWDSLFPSGATAAGPGGRDSGEGSAWRPAATWHAERSVEEGGLAVETLQGRRGSADTSSMPTAAAAASLSSWLSYLNLGSFETALVGVGVEAMGDLRYVEEQDLCAIGMHGPQIRKFLQNRP